MCIVNIIKGLDLSCASVLTRYYQNLILINRDDVDEFVINSDENNNSIKFSLKENKTGFLFSAPESGSSMKASFSKNKKDEIVYYNHNCELPIIGASEEIKTLLKQLDKANFFAAIHHYSDEIEILGFGYGLDTADYTYESQGSIGGAIIPLSSKFDEYDPPFIYKAVTEFKGDAIIDFNNLFGSLPKVYNGDFNNDFNNDFYVTNAN